MNRSALPLRLVNVGAPLALAAVLMAATPSGPPSADVMAVKVLPAAGGTEVIIDVRRGDVQVSDFVLGGPDRLVLDIAPARLVAPILRYDGVNRGGIRNVRFGQFRPDTVRVVLDLDTARDYEVRQDSAGVHVMLSGGGTYAAWPAGSRRTSGVVFTPPPAAPVSAPAVAPAQASEADAPSVLQGGLRGAPAAMQSQAPPISVTFDHATMEEVVATFAGVSGRSIILGSGIQATAVTAEIRNQPWDVAFYSILRSQGLAATEEPGGIIRVDSRANLISQDSTEPIDTRRVGIRYASATALLPSIQNVVSSRGKVAADTTTNSIILTERQSRIAAVDSFIRTLDIRIPQVAIQARIVSVNRTDLEALGLQYDLATASNYFGKLVQHVDTSGAAFAVSEAGSGRVVLGGNALAAIANAAATVPTPTLALVYSTVLGNYALSAFLQAAQTMTLSDQEAAPQTTVADNREAEIFNGQQIPIRVVDASATIAGGATAAVPRAQVRIQDAGIRLKVRPHVVEDTREVLMDLTAENSFPTASSLGDGNVIFNVQRGTTQLIVHDGETAVIGGLTVTTVTVTKSGIPFLVDLPVVGRLFGMTSTQQVRTDLLILVTPHIVDDIAAGGNNP